HFAEVTLQTISSKQSILTAQEIGISALPFSFDEGGKVTFGKTTSNQMLKKLSFFTTALETAYSSFKEDFSSFASVRIILDTSQFFTAQNEKLGLG
ncbi:hypothetical protein GWN91_04215, partial [Candidatus Saccharibacteria bacterium]|nr:hypothetical protein [Candidatus Saccharibacteria bacterium]NIV72147.1 hypothetical protein [Calditrichia bacterium]NIW78362.1 hypothetical protein [Calditrichia bacterium]